MLKIIVSNQATTKGRSKNVNEKENYTYSPTTLLYYCRKPKIMIMMTELVKTSYSDVLSRMFTDCAASALWWHLAVHWASLPQAS